MDLLTKPLPTLPCLCSNIRRASRALTQLYDEALRPSGLHATQFTVLQALSLTGEVTQGELGRLLVMDSTTLTRTLRLLQRQGWVESRPGRDRRERRLRLSPSGTRQLQRATPYWEAVQTKLQSSFGGRGWHELLHASTELTNRLQKISI